MNDPVVDADGLAATWRHPRRAAQDCGVDVRQLS